MTCADPPSFGYVYYPESKNHEAETGGLLSDRFTVSVSSKNAVYVFETTLTFHAIYIA